jgi:hypothetical protein
MGSKNFGPGVSGYLNPDGRAWETTVFQAGKPVLDTELNLQQDVDGGAGQLALRVAMPSGWLSADFLASSDMSEAIFLPSPTANFYASPTLLSHVNGWIIPVQNTGKNDGTNTIDMGLAPVGPGAKRADFVVLEVWRRLLTAAPSLDGKSPSGRIWRDGNVKISPADDALLNFPDDIKDATLGSESTKRVQIQYRLRVIQGVDPFAFPLVINDPTVVANSVPPNAATPDGVATIFPYVSQDAAGDAGLWRAGDGIPTNALGTVDGYMYAIPLAVVFRRNSNAFDRNTNQNGGVASPGPSDRPDSLFYDIFVPRDIADLRTGVTPNGWDFSEILTKNLNFLFDNKIRTEWTNALQGGGYDGHSVFAADEIGISNANGGDGIITGDTPGGTLIGQFDATRRFFSDRCVYETVVVKINAPGGGWLPGSVVTVQPTALEISPFAPFNWAAYNSAGVQFVDLVDGWWVGTPGQVTRQMLLTSVTGFGTVPLAPLTVTVGNIVGFGLSTEPLYLTLVVAYPRGEGLTRTPTDTFAGSFFVNNPGQLPAAAPVSFSALAPSNTIDAPHREVQLQYVTTNITTAVFESNSEAPGPYDFFMLPERVDTIVAVLKNAVPIIGGTLLDPSGRYVTFTNPLDFTVPGDTLQVTYTAIRPLPQNNEQMTIYYEARAPQTIRSSSLGTTLTVIPRFVGDAVYCLAVGSGSENEAYPFPVNYVQMGGIYPSSVGTFNGDHELSASADLAVTDFSSTNGLLRLPAFVGYTPAPEEVTFDRGLGDTDIEGRSYFKSVPVGYIPNAFAQQLSDAKRHRNIVPMIAELIPSSTFGHAGQLVLVLLLREAFFDPNNGVSFEPLLINTTTAAVFNIKGRLLNKGVLKCRPPKTLSLLSILVLVSFLPG